MQKQIRKYTLGEFHSDSAISENNIAMTLNKLEQWDLSK
jgi:hypothetical protein